MAAAERVERPGPGPRVGTEREEGAGGPERRRRRRPRDEQEEAEVEVELEDEPCGPQADWDEPEAPVWAWSPSSVARDGEERRIRPPAQRRRKSEYPRRRSCIAFTYGVSEGVARPEAKRVESRETQALGTSQGVPLQELPVLQSPPEPVGQPRPARGRWREQTSGDHPSTGAETQWELGYWESFPSASPCPVTRGQESGEPAATDTMDLVCETDGGECPPEGGFSLAGLAAVSVLPDSSCGPDLDHSDRESDDDGVPFRDDPKDEMYDPSPNRDRFKLKRKPRKVKVEPPEALEPPPRWVGVRGVAGGPSRGLSGTGDGWTSERIQRPKEDRGPRPPKKRKKPPIQYVRCEVEGCGTILANPRYLQHHMRYQHMTKKKYVCPHPTCGRLFRLQKQLLRHTKHHSNQRDYICEYCARAFKSSHNLAVHRMIHTGEKPLQCEICGFTCRQKASLNWHMKKHDAEAGYQFSCDVCGKRFEKKDSVVAHKSKSHPELLIAEALADSSEMVQS